MSKELKPLILCGGKSSRMGEDKARLKLKNITYLEHISQVLCSALSLNDNQYITLSCREEQVIVGPYNNYVCITDKYPDIGPIGGIVSAMETHPAQSWLVLACDMPNINEKLLKQLISVRNPEKSATIFTNNDYLEPLCAIYEPGMLFHLQKSIHEQEYSLTHCLKQLPVETVTPLNPALLKNINTPADLPV